MQQRVLGIALILFIGLAGLWLVNPMLNGYMRAKIFGIGFHEPAEPPAIARDVDFDWQRGRKGDSEWTDVLRQTFPTGSQEADLEKTLRDQGFKIDTARRSARYQWGTMPCLFTVRVTWTTAGNGRIVSVSGSNAAACT
jgi:hypothetical protein